MDVSRDIFDGIYDSVKPIVFGLTDGDPEIAHRLFVNSLKVLRFCRLDKLVLDNSANKMNPGCIISSAAGSNKNAEIDPRVMNWLGYDRVVVGTVTADAWDGNPRPRIERFVKTDSMVNWMGLPGVGAEEVARRLYGYGDHGIPLTINLMATPDPNKSYKKKLEDLEETIDALRDVPFVNRFELNISCPNTCGSDGAMDARAENLRGLNGIVNTVRRSMHFNQDLYLKVSPDSTMDDVKDIVKIGERFGVDGYVTANTTTEHYKKFIPDSPGKGGASGRAVWPASVRTQRRFAEGVNSDIKVVACGGIDSVESARYRLGIGVTCEEIQLLTGPILKGTGLLRELREGL